MNSQDNIRDMRDVTDAVGFMRAGVDAIDRRRMDLTDPKAVAAVNDYANQVRELAEQLMRKCEEIEARNDAEVTA